MSSKSTELQPPELFFGLAAAAGTDGQAVEDSLRTALSLVGYDAVTVRLSEALDMVDWSSIPGAPTIDDSTVDSHISTRMDAGNCLREKTGTDAMAVLAILKIKGLRGGDTPIPSHAYILRSLKTPQEVRTLREVYGPNFFLISAYTPVGMREELLTTAIRADWERQTLTGKGRSPQGVAADLIERDRAEGDDYGQQLEETFAQADVFVDARSRPQLNDQLRRFVEMIFNDPFHTPTRDENAMFHAQAAALRSAAPSRQVGAAITTEDGRIVAVGANDVPKAGGGQYWSDDPADHRDHNRNVRNVSGTEKQVVVEQILRRMKEKGWLSDTALKAETPDFYGLLEGLRVRDLIEFERAVHAEMSAIVDAAQRGVSIDGCTIYTTTFPCHECTRHVIAAGLMRLVYIEPYPKSRAASLHDDALTIDVDNPPAGKVAFVPFVGVAPRRYLELFTPGRGVRKSGDIVADAKPGKLPKSVPAIRP